MSTPPDKYVTDSIEERLRIIEHQLSFIFEDIAMLTKRTEGADVNDGRKTDGE